jgi:hypothetical protein
MLTNPNEIAVPNLNDPEKVVNMVYQGMGYKCNESQGPNTKAN